MDVVQVDVVQVDVLLVNMLKMFCVSCDELLININYLLGER